MTYESWPDVTDAERSSAVMVLQEIARQLEVMRDELRLERLESELLASEVGPDISFLLIGLEDFD